MPDKTYPPSSMNLKPTPKQVRAITKLCLQLETAEPMNYPRNRREARNLIYELRNQWRKLNDKEGTPTTLPAVKNRDSTPLL